MEPAASETRASSSRATSAAPSANTAWFESDLRREAIGGAPLAEADIIERRRNGLAVSLFRTRAEVEEQIKDHRTLRRIEQQRESADAKQRELEAIREQIRLEEEELCAAQAEKRDLEAQVAALRERVSNEILRRADEAALQRQLEGNAQRATRAFEALATAKKQFDLCERQLDVAQVEARELDQLDAGLQRKFAEQEQERRVIAEYQQRVQQRAREYALRKAQKKLAREEEQRQAELQKLKAEMEQSRTLNSKARKRVEEKLAHTRARRKRICNDLQSLKLRRAQQLVQLRSSIEHSRAELTNARVEREALEAQHEASLAKEREELAAAGLNPDLVFGVRREQQIKQNRKKNLQAQIRAEEEKILDRIMHEGEQQRVREEMEEKEKEAAAQYARSLGPGYREKRTSAYMRSRLDSGEEFVDPTGRTYSLFPSQITSIRDRRFGTGLADERVVRATLAKVDASARKEPDAAAEETTPAAAESSRQSERPVSPAATDLQSTALANGAGLGSDSSAAAAHASDDSDGEQNGVHPKKIAPQRKLSKFERERLEAAQQRYRERLAANGNAGASKICGKEYAGPKFLAHPEAIEFLDFEVGKSMEQRVVLTNVSFGFNHFKPLPLDDAIVDLFEVDCPPPGRLSAGMTAGLTVTFTPRLNEDVDGKLDFLAETGRFSIPIVCRTKKCSVSLSSRVIDFGTVVLGNTATHSVQISNSGALAVPFFAIPRALASNSEDRADKDHTAEEGEAAARALHFRASDSLGARGTVTFSLTLQPVAAGPFEWRLLLHFGAASPADADLAAQRESENRRALQWGSANEFELVVRGNVVPVPIYAAADVLDFQHCLLGKLYRAPMLLHNRGANAMRFKVTVPPPFGGLITVAPDVGFVQSDTPFPLYVRFEAKTELAERARASKEGPTILDVPLTVTVADQSLPVVFRVKATLVGGTIDLSTERLDFGECLIGQAVSLPLVIRNSTPLVQKLCFHPLPAFLRFSPGDGLVSLLPGESVSARVSFVPRDTSSCEFPLQCWSKLGFTKVVTCTGRGVRAALDLSASHVQLAPTCSGLRRNVTLFLSNMSASSHMVEAYVIAETDDAAPSELTLTPAVGILAPGARLPLELTFAPRVAAAAAEEAMRLQPQADDAESESVRFHPLVDGRAWCRIARRRVLIFARPVHPESKQPLENAATSTLSLHATTLALAPALSASPAELVFSNVLVGERAVATIELQNASEQGVSFTVLPLEVTSPFKPLVSLSALPAKASALFAVAFSPAAPRKYRETLRLQTEFGELAVPLEGIAIAPELVTDAPDNALDFGHVLVGQRVQRTLTVTNRSSFPVRVPVVEDAWPGVERRDENIFSGRAFTIEPHVAAIDAGGSTQLCVTFSPDREGTRFASAFRIGDVRLGVRGSAWEQQVFVMRSGAEDEDAAQSHGLPKVVVAEDPVLLALGVGAAGSSTAAPVVFAKGKTTYTLSLGACTLEGKEDKKEKGGAKATGTAGTFQISLTGSAAAAFTAEPASGSLVPGAISSVSLHFSAEALHGKRESGPAASVPQWAEAELNVTLRGGAAARGAAAAADRTLKFTVRALASAH